MNTLQLPDLLQFAVVYNQPHLTRLRACQREVREPLATFIQALSLQQTVRL